MQSLWLKWNQNYPGLKGNQGIVMQMDLYGVSMIEMKSKYSGLKWNLIIVIENRSMCGVFEWCYRY